MKALLSQVQVELLLFLRDRTATFFSLLFPLLMVAFFGYLNREGQVENVSYASFLVAGGIGMVVSSAAFENLGVALARQRDEGILKRLGGTPLRPWTLVGAKVLAAAFIILVQTILMTAVNVLLFDAEISGAPLWILTVLLMGVLTFATLGLALAGLSRNTDVATAAASALSMPMQFLCGTFFPVDEMPALLRHIAHALPLTYLVDALRGAMLGGGNPWDYAKDWAVLLGCLALAFAIAVKTFRWE
ncbi:MAG: ABC transporter permease [Anaerolineae bacterium]